MPENTSNDLIKDPIRIATEMLAFQQDRIVAQIMGPQAPQRRQMVGDTPLEEIMPQVLARMEPEIQ